MGLRRWWHQCWGSVRTREWTYCLLRGNQYGILFYGGVAQRGAKSGLVDGLEHGDARHDRHVDDASAGVGRGDYRSGQAAHRACPAVSSEVADGATGVNICDDCRIDMSSTSGATPTNPSASDGLLAMMAATVVPCASQSCRPSPPSMMKSPPPRSLGSRGFGQTPVSIKALPILLLPGRRIPTGGADS